MFFFEVLPFLVLGTSDTWEQDGILEVFQGAVIYLNHCYITRYRPRIIHPAVVANFFSTEHNFTLLVSDLLIRMLEEASSCSDGTTAAAC